MNSYISKDPSPSKPDGVIAIYVAESGSEDSERTSQGPISRLPPELLHKIFPHCLLVSRDGWVFPDLSRAPLTLGSVCRTWRKASIDCPALWNSLGIGADPWFKRESCIAGIELWLSRSGNLPLLIENRCTPLPTIHDGFLQVICSHINHWSVVSLRINASSNQLGALLSTGAPMLKKLAIDLSDRQIEHDRNSPLDLTGAHNLERLTFSSGPSFRVVPPSSLARLFIMCNVPVDHVLTLFQHCPSLRYVHIRPTSAEGLSNNSPILPILMASLTRLDIYDEGGASILLDCLLMPSISLLFFRVMRSQDPLWAHLSPALRRSQSDLQELKFSRGTLSEGEIIECLRLSPNLNKFELGTRIHNQPMSCIIAHLTNKSPLICPSLHHLTIHDPYIDISVELVSQLLQCRWQDIGSTGQTQTPLKGLYLRHDYAIDDYRQFFRENPVIRQCSEEGFGLTVDGGNHVFSV